MVCDRTGGGEGVGKRAVGRYVVAWKFTFVGGDRVERSRLVSPFDGIAGLDREAIRVKCERWSFDGNPVSLRHLPLPCWYIPRHRLPQRSETVNHLPAG